MRKIKQRFDVVNMIKQQKKSEIANQLMLSKLQKKMVNAMAIEEISSDYSDQYDVHEKLQNVDAVSEGIPNEKSQEAKKRAPEPVILP